MITALLSPDAGQVVQAGRSALRASEADRDRVERALRQRLGAHALPLPAVERSRRFGVSARFVSGAAIGVCVLASTLFVAVRSLPSAPIANPAVQATPKSAMATPLSVPAQPARNLEATTLNPAVGAVVPASPHVPAKVAQPDQLTQEVALLSRATSALRAGRFAEALKDLNEHERQFPNGTLSEERSAAKAQALCSLGRVEAGRVELSHLIARSPAWSRAAQVCDSVATPG